MANALGFLMLRGVVVGQTDSANLALLFQVEQRLPACFEWRAAFCGLVHRVEIDALHVETFLGRLHLMS